MNDHAPPRTPAPAISVLITVRNGLPYLEEALRSIMTQSFRDIEIIVVDDASTDATPEVLARLAGEDRRIRILTLETNLRQAAAGNAGLDLVRAPLVARMDADDIAPPERLAVQKAWMDAHPETILLAASARYMTPEGRVYRARATPGDDFTLRWEMRFQMPFTHPTFLFRRQGPQGPLRYDPEWRIGEDYDLAWRAGQQGGLACLPDFLVDVRIHKTSTMGSRSAADENYPRRLARRAQEAALPPDLVAGLAPFMELHYDFAAPTPARLRAAAAGLRRVLRRDIAQRPDLAPWMRRQAAMMLFRDLHRTMPARQAGLLLLRQAPDLALAAGLRMAESRYGLFARAPKVA